MQSQAPEEAFGNKALTNVAKVQDEPEPEPTVATICSVGLTDSNPTRALAMCKDNRLNKWTVSYPTNSPQPSHSFNKADRFRLLADVIMICGLMSLVLLAM
ncbi:hypothetical protein EV426DRAFT_577168 [Tirmania nivea]|nr:hypothetical protein EV426DRAFT_577168 [Tirmania nivea]